MNVDKLKTQLEVDEGRKKRIYVDTVGKITGGVGRNLTDRDFSDDEVDLMLTNDINMIIAQYDKLIPWWRQLNDVRQNVLINMGFMGVNKVMGFKNTLAAMKEGRYAAAADGMLDSLWAKQVHARADRLAAMMRSGEFL